MSFAAVFQIDRMTGQTTSIVKDVDRYKVQTFFGERNDLVADDTTVNERKPDGSFTGYASLHDAVGYRSSLPADMQPDFTCDERSEYHERRR